MRTSLSKIIFIIAALICLFPFIENSTALFLGILVSFFVGNPYQYINNRLTKILLQVSVVGLGFGMNIYEALSIGREGLLFTAVSIASTLVIGLLLGYFFKVKKNTSVLISSGTAICGGSAIAALTPIIDADESETSIALATIFILNSIALILFPPVGHLFKMSQDQFGLWSAIAIHDTSSVVGAAQKYGDRALHLATTIKLERALWIIPLSLIFSFLYKKGDGNRPKMYIPYFIFLYIVSMGLNTLIPFVQTYSSTIVFLSKKCMTLTLFLIGAGLSKQMIKSIGFKPFLQGGLLWMFISLLSFIFILNFVLI